MVWTSEWSEHCRSYEIPHWSYGWADQIARWTGPCKVLELGAGSGKTSILLFRKGFDVSCLDNDPEVIEVMRSNFEKYDADIEIQERDIADIKGRFDVIFSCGVLEHLDDDKLYDTYRSILRHLRTGGLSIQFVPTTNAVYQAAIRYRMSRRSGSEHDTDDRHAFESLKMYHPHGLRMLREYKTGFLHAFHSAGWLPLLRMPVFNIEKVLLFKTCLNRLPGTWLTSVSRRDV